MKDLCSPVEQADARESPRTRVECPVWHSPAFFPVPGGIEWRCKSCRGVIHFISREKIERAWNEMEQGAQHITDTALTG